MLLPPAATPLASSAYPDAALCIASLLLLWLRHVCVCVDVTFEPSSPRATNGGTRKQHPQQQQEAHGSVIGEREGVRVTTLEQTTFE